MLLRIATLLLCCVPALAWPHAGSKSWLTLQVEGTELEGQLVASVVDAALALQLDIRASPAVLRPQIAARRDELRAYAAHGLVVLLNGERGQLEFSAPTEAVQGGEEVLVFALHASAATRIDTLDVGYTLFFEDDVLHECLARIGWDGGGHEEKGDEDDECFAGRRGHHKRLLFRGVRAEAAPVAVRASPKNRMSVL
jgi:hypothetical protein